MVEVTRIQTDYDDEGRVVGAHEVPVDQSQQCPTCGKSRVR